MKILKIPGALILGLGLILLLIWSVIQVKEYFYPEKNSIDIVPSKESDTSAKLEERPPDISTETPCSPTFDYDFDMKVGGPVKIKFPGVSDTIYWDGKSDIRFPDRKSGPVYIASQNPYNRNVSVEIWKK